jgi:hypothetical protein
MRNKTKKIVTRKRYITTLQRLIVGEWYQTEHYIFQFAGKQLRPDLVKVRKGSPNPDDDYDWFSKVSVNHTGCIKSWDDFSETGWFWKTEIAGCVHLENFVLPLKYQNNDQFSN